MAHGNKSMNVLRINAVLRRVRVNMAAVEKQYYISWVSAALLTQYTMRMRQIILSSFACLALPYFSTLPDKRHDFREKKLQNIKRMILLSLQLLHINWMVLIPLSMIHHIDTVNILMFLLKHYVFWWKISGALVQNSKDSGIMVLFERSLNL